MTDRPLQRREPWYLTFHDLMPHRVHEILLVSSEYDAFTLEEDGRLTERIFTQYSELNLSSAPRITHVSTGARAMDLLSRRRFDLVMTMVRLADTDVVEFGKRVKARFPAMPVVLLMLTEADLKNFPGEVDRTAIDRVFVWTGDARILLAIIKLVEDSLNVDHDTRTAGVRAIIVVEDSVRRLSSFLSLLYAELMTQSESLIAEGVNDLHRLFRMRARPKILLATSFEEATSVYRRYRDSVVAVISDVRFPRGGEEDPAAGFELVKLMRAEDPELPILVQSAEAGNAERAKTLGVHYADKNSPSLLKQLREFVTESLGFGDFVFRLPDRAEVGRARSMYEMETVLASIPAAALEYHATRNHFSLWLMARCMFRLAERLRPRTIAEFGGVEGLRKHLIDVLREARVQEQEGVIADFSSRQTGPESLFVRIGMGSIGGKARGLAFVSSLLAGRGLSDCWPEMPIRIPRSVAIGTNEFDRFIEENRLADERGKDDRWMLDRCLAGKLPDGLQRDLRKAFADMKGPLAVRSSSLLEDSQLQPFAGIYATFMLPNNHPDAEVRFQELCQAIKAVYASTFSKDARAYIAGTPYSLEEEKMGIVIQEMVGRSYGNRYYPAVSGVGLSVNYYPVGHQRAEDGLVLVALGLGQTVVAGGAALQFSPRNPQVLPQFSEARDFLRYSQSVFYALDTSRNRVDFTRGDDASLMLCDLAAAEQDGPLKLVGSVYVREDDVIRDGLSTPGPRVVTFNNILKWGTVPLAPALAELLEVLRDGLGCAVEIEFALDVGDWGQVVSGREPLPPTLYLLQVRPQATQLLATHVETDRWPEDQILVKTDKSLGHGVVETVKDVVYVKRRDLDSLATPGVARQVGEANARLQAEKRQYVLIGPGRWGSSDSRLGIPVKWYQIAGARVIVETSFNDRDVEPSQGAHFFHNVTSFRIGYLTLLGASSRQGPRWTFDTAWLDAQPAAWESAEVRHVRLDRPLRIHLDGKTGAAAILKPALPSPPPGSLG